MTTLVDRPYSGPQDLQSMLNLLANARPANRITDYPSMVDLRELLALDEVQNNTRLWFDREQGLVGFALVDQYNNLLLEVLPQPDSTGLEAQMVAWGAACVSRAAAPGQSCTLDASCREDDPQRIAMLERNGFVRQEGRSLRMTRSLTEPIPAPRLPRGFSMRRVMGEQEAQALVDLHRAAFGTHNMTLAERLAMMRVPDYDPELDLVVVSPEGRLAGYCMCSISREENALSGRKEGCTDPVAVHPDFQRRGLAKALLLAGLLLLKQHGMDSAVLGTSGENSAMQRAAKGVGFVVSSTTVWFTRPITDRSSAQR